MLKAGPPAASPATHPGSRGQKGHVLFQRRDTPRWAWASSGTPSAGGARFASRRHGGVIAVQHPQQRGITGAVHRAFGNARERRGAMQRFVNILRGVAQAFADGSHVLPASATRNWSAV